MLEAMKMFDEGMTMESIDAAALQFGMPMGPIELADTVGLDVGLSVVKKLGGDGADKAVERLQKMVDEGVLGKKSGQGFYQWTNGKPVKKDGKSTSSDESTADSQPSKEQLDTMAERLLKPFLDECRACSEEGIVEDDDLLDAGIIFGTGFAPFHGGPMHYLKTHS
jgi:3-hydroxyacyl-CoA dehydrogenase/enoyl-CoA hydratase/3-hydroxybutyryl-CoA epimerase